jgi:putative hydrolase of the HAD superfamily
VIDVVVFDGDDTLWHSEHLFVDAHARFADVLAPYVDDRDHLERAVEVVERRNLGLFGYGAKGFTLSLIETAIELSGGQIRGNEVQTILELGKALLDHPVELLDGVDEVTSTLAGRRLALLTKGDLLHQESKIARSGLAERFERVEIVSEKDDTTFSRLLAALAVPPERVLMVGNSVRSDVVPARASGAHAAVIPYRYLAAIERIDEPDPATLGYHVLGSMREVPGLLADLDLSSTR